MSVSSCRSASFVGASWGAYASPPLCPAPFPDEVRRLALSAGASFLCLRPSERSFSRWVAVVFFSSSAAAAAFAGSAVFVGCARGVDAYFRSAFPSAQVFSVSSGRWGSGRGAFAARSIACVRAVARSRGLWVSFPNSACPESLLPSASPSRCFCGTGSGTWSSLAFALGLGVPCVVFSSCGVPAGWGLSPVPGCPGWFGCPVALGSAVAEGLSAEETSAACTPRPVQLSLF